MRAALVLLVAAFALTGCYVSKTQLLDPKQAVRPLALGNFESGEKPGEILDVSQEAGGWYRVYEIGDDDATRVMFTPLPGQDGTLAMVMVEEGGKRGYMYGLAHRGDDGLVHLEGASCSNEAAKRAAIAQQATITGSAETPTCEFTTRASLQAALADYAKSWDWRAASTTLPAADAPADVSPPVREGERPAPGRRPT